MVKTLKYIGYIILLGLAIISLYMINLFAMKPYSIDHYLAKELTMGLLDSPEFMTYIGIFDKYNAVLKHNQKLSIRTLEDGDEDYQDSLAHLSMLKSYDSSKLTDIQKVTQKIAIFDTENNINEFENFRYHSYPFNQIGGNHLGLVEFMTDTHPVRNLREASDYIKRVEKFDESLNANLIWLEEQKKLGIFAPKYVFDHVITQLKELIAYEDSDNPLMQVFARKVDALDIDEQKSEELKTALSAVIASDVKSGFKSILGFFESNYEYANTNHGVWSLPNGDAFYEARLRSYTTTDYSAEEIHQIGLSEVDRIGARMKEIFLQLGYQVNKPVGEMMNDLNENPDFLYPDTPDRKEIVVADYNQMVKEAEEDVRPYFARFPVSPVEVRAIPEYSEQTAAGGYYQAPALDGSRPGVFYANLYDIKQTPTFGMRTLTFHEAVPGHHFQIALNQENEELTLYRKMGYRTSAFTEGWALYSEQLAVEVGMTKNLYDELGVLQSEMFRANRLVVDTGMHYKRWTREEAMAYMKKTTGMSDTEVRVEIERYIVWPGQATSYKMGMLKILELRKKAQDALGEEFDIRTFHTVVLDQGIVPLFILEDIIDEWIATS
ncbi:DUF885 domain-containing protein [Gammaproteobacteria bacterium]|nr:DUF885 domain-containing protein [Gammaproteobacteria bacterium]MDB9815671.1 DUF885 domain-containing protein [Gammaproteobacteria bacterium]MDB9860191.1 DUF885 domain-containing protein [Gammaproteobacteria bacterium]MDB9940208.1 DUF885 domain-containing protein [Gammaproteobacteria bacterium]